MHPGSCRPSRASEKRGSPSTLLRGIGLPIGHRRTSAADGRTRDTGRGVSVGARSLVLFLVAMRLRARLRPARADVPGAAGAAAVDTRGESVAPPPLLPLRPSRRLRAVVRQLAVALGEGLCGHFLHLLCEVPFFLPFVFAMTFPSSSRSMPSCASAMSSMRNSQ